MDLASLDLIFLLLLNHYVMNCVVIDKKITKYGRKEILYKPY